MNYKEELTSKNNLGKRKKFQKSAGKTLWVRLKISSVYICRFCYQQNHRSTSSEKSK